MSNDDYHNDTSRIGKSGLDEIAKSPAHYYAQYLDPNRVKKDPTEAQLLGTATHYAILEPDLFEKQYLILPDGIDRRTKEGKGLYNYHAELAAANGQTLIKPADFDHCCRMRDAVHAHPAAAVLLESGQSEQALLFEHFQTGADCKMRPDFLSETTKFIVDIKTTTDASPYEFGKSVVNYGYHRQAAFYWDGYGYAMGECPQGFAFIAVEKEPPYAVAVYYADDEVLNLGRASYLKDLQTYVECLKSNVWPAYSDTIQKLQLPAWALK